MTRIAVLCSDIAEASQVKWICGLRAAGAEVHSYGFRRANMNPGLQPDWPHQPLGRIGNGVTPGRLAALARAVPRLRRHRAALDAADVVLARDLDMALLALAAGLRAPLVYVNLDIHRLLSRAGLAGSLARRTERVVLARSRQLITSAPEFVTRHFVGRQGYAGPIRIVENRILWPGERPPRGPVALPRGPVRLGWVGTLRCPATFSLLLSVAACGNGAVEVILRGTPHRHQLPEFEARVAATPHIRYEGAYDYPSGLALAYRDLDCVWGQDLWQSGANSDWLLPNRIYEAGYFGCPVIAVAGSATAEKVTAGGSGLALPRATARLLLEALTGGAPRLRVLRAEILSRPADIFCLTPKEMLEAVCPTARHDPLRSVPDAA